MNKQRLVFTDYFDGLVVYLEYIELVLLISISQCNDQLQYKFQSFHMDLTYIYHIYLSLVLPDTEFHLLQGDVLGFLCMRMIWEEVLCFLSSITFSSLNYS